MTLSGIERRLEIQRIDSDKIDKPLTTRDQSLARLWEWKRSLMHTLKSVKYGSLICAGCVVYFQFDWTPTAGSVVRMVYQTGLALKTASLSLEVLRFIYGVFIRKSTSREQVLEGITATVVFCCHCFAMISFKVVLFVYGYSLDRETCQFTGQAPLEALRWYVLFMTSVHTSYYVIRTVVTLAVELSFLLSHPFSPKAERLMPQQNPRAARFVSLILLKKIQ